MKKIQKPTVFLLAASMLSTTIATTIPTSVYADEIAYKLESEKAKITEPTVREDGDKLILTFDSKSIAANVSYVTINGKKFGLGEGEGSIIKNDKEVILSGIPNLFKNNLIKIQTIGYGAVEFVYKDESKDAIEDIVQISGIEKKTYGKSMIVNGQELGEYKDGIAIMLNAGGGVNLFNLMSMVESVSIDGKNVKMKDTDGGNSFVLYEGEYIVFDVATYGKQAVKDFTNREAQAKRNVEGSHGHRVAVSFKGGEKLIFQSDNYDGPIEKIVEDEPTIEENPNGIAKDKKITKAKFTKSGGVKELQMTTNPKLTKDQFEKITSFVINGKSFNKDIFTWSKWKEYIYISDNEEVNNAFKNHSGKIEIKIFFEDNSVIKYEKAMAEEENPNGIAKDKNITKAKFTKSGGIKELQMTTNPKLTKEQFEKVTNFVINGNAFDKDIFTWSKYRDYISTNDDDVISVVESNSNIIDIKVNFDDNSLIKYNGAIELPKDNEKYNPIVKDEILVSLNGELPDAKDVIVNYADIHATSAMWKGEVDTKSAGNKQAQIEVTFEDGSKSTLDAEIKVVEEKQKEKVNFESLVANGASNTETTTELTITLNKAIDLKKEDITLVGAKKVNLEKTGIGKYKLSINEITKENGEKISVSLDKEGFTFTPKEKTVSVFVKEENTGEIADGKTVEEAIIGGYSNDSLKIKINPSFKDFNEAKKKIKNIIVNGEEFSYKDNFYVSSTDDLIQSFGEGVIEAAKLKDPIKVKIEFIDGSTIENQVEESNIVEPIGKNISVNQNAQLPDAKTAIGNSDSLPNDTKYSWKEEITTSEIGNEEAVVVVKYPTGEIREVKVTIIVNKESENSLNIGNLKDGVYTLGFKAYQSGKTGEENLSSMVTFFDKKAKLVVEGENKTISFLNYKHASQLVDFVIKEDGQYKKLERKVIKKDAKGRDVDVEYSVTLKNIDKILDSKVLVTIGASENDTGNYALYNGFDLVFNQKATEGFTNYEIIENRETAEAENDNRLIEALIQAGFDLNKDGTILRKNYKQEVQILRKQIGQGNQVML
ncbi:MAG: Rib/alpha-like domain-containing protein [Peptoniphilaceae bacterium]